MSNISKHVQNVSRCAKCVTTRSIPVVMCALMCAHITPVRNFDVSKYVENVSHIHVQNVSRCAKCVTIRHNVFYSRSNVRPNVCTYNSNKKFRCVKICRNQSINLAMCQNMSKTCHTNVENVSQNVELPHNVSKYVSICRDGSQFVDICRNVSKTCHTMLNLTICGNMSQFVEICHNMSTHATICRITSQFVELRYNVSKYVEMCHYGVASISRIDK